jgi:hypothetical protein
MTKALENTILNVLAGKKKVLKEETVIPKWEDLGPAIIDPRGSLPDYTKGITAGQAALPRQPLVADDTLLKNDTIPFVPQEVKENVDDKKKKDDDDDEDEDEDEKEYKDKKSEVKEDFTADEENARQKAKVAKSEKMKKLKETGVKEDEEDSTDADKKEMAEDVNALFVGENISEAFKKKATIIYEAAIASKVKNIADKRIVELEEHYSTEFIKGMDEIKEALTTKVNSYLNYVVEHWLEENQLAVELGIRAELTEDFIQKLKVLFTEHYIEIPEDKVDVVNSLTEQISNIEAKLDEQLTANIALKEQNDKFRQGEILREVSTGLSDSQKDRLIQMAESIEFKNTESFKEKVITLKESHLIKLASKVQNLTEEKDPKVVPQDKPGQMGSILAALKRTTV